MKYKIGRIHINSNKYDVIFVSRGGEGVNPKTFAVLVILVQTILNL